MDHAAAAAGFAVALEVAGVLVEWRDADEFCDLLAFALVKLGK